MTPDEMKEMISKPFARAKSMTHQEFKEQVKAGKIKFEVMVKNKYKVLEKSHRIIFFIYVSLYLVLPIIAVPFFAWHYGNWNLLWGLLISALASALNKKISLLLLAYTVYCLIGWFRVGFHFEDPFTFYAVCAWWGAWWFLIADAAEEQFFKEAVLTNEDIFDSYADQNLILIVDAK